MAAQQDQFELRTSNYNKHQELILVWPLPPDHLAEDLNRFTRLVPEPTNELNDCLRYIHENDRVTKLFFITGDGAGLSAEQRIESLRSSLRQSNREIRLITFVWNQNNAGPVEHINDTGQYFNDFSQLCIHLEEALSATNDIARSLAGSTMSLNLFSSEILDLNCLNKLKILICWKRTLVQTLLELNQPRTDIDHSLDCLAQFYAHESTMQQQIRKFRDEYFLSDRPNGPIWWFTRGTFLSKCLQRALLEKDVKRLFQLRFFIRDLYQQLHSLQTSTAGHDNLTVYRSMIPTATDLPDTGALLTMDTFLSTSTSLELAEIFAEPSSIIFEIQTGAREETGFVLGNLAQLITDIASVPLDQQEVLFQLYTSFRVHGIRADNNRQYVALRLLGREELDRMANEVDEESQNTYWSTQRFLEPGKQWQEWRNIANAVEYYQQLFPILLSYEKEPMDMIMVQLETLYDDEQERSMKRAMISPVETYPCIYFPFLLVQRSRCQLSETVQLSGEAQNSRQD